MISAVGLRAYELRLTVTHSPSYTDLSAVGLSAYESIFARGDPFVGGTAASRTPASLHGIEEGTKTGRRTDRVQKAKQSATGDRVTSKHVLPGARESGEF